MMARNSEAIIIGGGFYGAAIAIYLVKQRRFKHVQLIEREASLCSRASYKNQARVHNGYHYPRSFTTAYRSRINFPKFVRDWPEAVRRDFTKLYAIARRSSKVTARQFERFCNEIGAKIQPVDSNLRSLFEPRLIEEIFLVEEYAFDAMQLSDWAYRELNESGVNVCLQTRVTNVSKGKYNNLVISLVTKDGNEENISSKYVFNCTYSGINQLGGGEMVIQTGIQQEITELALMQMPPVLQELGITVMDGPFFSIMPFPPRRLHTLSHVRYTPHIRWQDEYGIDPYQKLNQYDCISRADRMVKDVERYIPAIVEAQYVDSLYEVKSVLIKNENDDGRPILFEKYPQLPGCYAILGGKIDNIYDVLERLDQEQFS